MFRKNAIPFFALLVLAIGSASARAQFAPAIGPAIGPPSGPVPTTPSTFPPLTLPAPPPDWLGSPSTPGLHPPQVPAQQQSYTIYYRVSETSPWKVYAVFNSQSDAVWAVNCLKAAGYSSFYR